MANKLREGPGSLALAVAENARHRDFEIIVPQGQLRGRGDGRGAERSGAPPRRIGGHLMSTKQRLGN
jgi:hypothetical protein